MNTDNQVCEIVSALREVNTLLEENNAKFNLASDDDILDSLIYERCALEAKYAFLIKRARECGINSDF